MSTPRRILIVVAWVIAAGAWFTPVGTVPASDAIGTFDYDCGSALDTDWTPFPACNDKRNARRWTAGIITVGAIVVSVSGSASRRDRATP